MNNSHPTREREKTDAKPNKTRAFYSQTTTIGRRKKRRDSFRMSNTENTRKSERRHTRTTQLNENQEYLRTSERSIDNIVKRQAALQ